MAVQAPEVEPSETPPVEQVPADEEQAVDEVPGITTDLENPAVSPADGSDVDPGPPTGADDESEYSASDESLMQALPQGFAGRSAGPGLLSNGGDDGLMHIADFVSIGINTELVAPGDVLARLYSDVPDLLRNPIVGQESVSVRLEYTGPRGTCVYGATHHTGPQGIVLRWGNLGDQRVPAAEVYSPQSGGTIVTESRAGLMGWWKNSQIPGANLSENVYTATFHPPTDVSIPAMRVELDLWEYPVNQHGQCISRMLPTTVEHVTVDAELEADFVATVSTTDPLEFGFESRASDPQQATADLSHAWDFGDGETSTAINPTHRFEAPGVYSVTLEVTNDRGQTDSLTRSVTVGAGLIVNSAGDAPAEDPAEGCDTGDTVGEDDAPECTLRAAIEAANAVGGGEITFNIPGTPVIVPGSALPKVTVPVTIDGTTQDGGWVEVAGSSGFGVVLAGPASTLRGLAVHGFEQAIRVESGEGHEITGVRVGLDRTGAATSDTVFGVAVTGGTATISDSESGAETGVAARAPVTVTGNRLGVGASGAPVPGAKVGVWIESAGGEVADNTIYGEIEAVLLLGEDAVDAQVTGNRIGTDGTTAFVGSGIGVSVQGAPGATITGNTIESASFAGVLVSGSNQTTEEDDKLLVNSPLDDPAEAPVTGGGATVRGNTIGSGDDNSGLAGVWAWAGAESITVENNTVRAANNAGVILDGGSGHRVADNTLGSQSAPLEGSGIEADEVGEVMVEANSIYAHDAGVRAAGVAPRVTGNTVTGVGTDAIGISVTAEQDGVVLDGNTVRKAASSGILVDGPRVEVRNNTIVQSGIGITTSGEGIVLRENLIGIETANGALLGNTGHGVQVYSGSIDASRNVIAGSGGNGVDVAPGATAKLTGNRIWASAGQAIANPDGPETPGIAAAIIADTDGSPLTTILIDGLAEGETGTIEVFANDTAAGGQAQHVLGATRSIGAHETVRIVQLASSRDHFTVTFTDSSGNTSELSEVASRQAFPDSDGDGAVDPIDGILGLEQDPTVAILATRNEQLLLARVTPYDLETDFGGGRFENLRVVDDPTPGAHPEGWSLPYGALAFRISDLPYGGARTSVMFASFYGDDPLLGNAYWKYGPQTTGGSPSWYEFTWDDEAQTGGAIRVADLGSLGFRPAHVLILEDGARGDSDGGMNRSITDPGGPVIYTAGNGHSGNTGDAGPAQASPSSLTTTGSDSETMQLMLGIALLLAAIGASLLLLGGGRHSLSRSGR